MKEKPIGKSSAKARTDWKQFRALNGPQIRRGIESDPEIRPTNPDFWKDAHVVIPEAKQTITIRLDADLLQWLRQQKGYQTRINAVLRAYMDAKRTSPEMR